MPDSPDSSGGAFLLCLDMQPAFLKAVPDAEQLVKRCSLAVTAAQGFGFDIAFTEQAPGKLGSTTPELLACADQPAVYPKNTFSALSDEAILNAITSAGAEHLLLCGLETSICVYQTALEAVANNLQVTVLSDAVGGRRSEDGQLCLKALAASGVYVLPSETVFYSLLHSIKHPFFKKFTELVKKYG